MLRLFRRLSLPHFRATSARTLLIVTGIAVGVALMVAIAVINATVLADFRRSLELGAGPAALEVTLGLGEIGFDADVVAAVRADPDVATAVPLVRGTIALAATSAEPLTLVGTDLSAEGDLRRYRQFSTADESDVALAVGDPRAVLLTTEFATRHRIRAGDQVDFRVPRGIETLTVRGLFTAEGAAAVLAGQLAVMDLGPAQEKLDIRGRLHQVDVVLRDGADIETVQRRLAARVPPVLRVARPVQRGAAYDGVLGSFQLMLSAVSIICLVAGAYLVYNTTTTSAVHRGLTMATLRLFGAASATVFRLLMLESLVLGTAGVAAGIPLGITLAHLLVQHVATSMGVIFQLRFPVQVPTVSLASLAGIAAAGVGTSFAASFSAARRLARLEPLEILRTELRSLTTHASNRQLWLCWLGLAATSIAALVAEVQLQSPAWGNFSSTLWYASIVVMSIPLARSAAPWVARVLRRLFGAVGAFAGDSLARAPTRGGVTMAAIALMLTVGMTFVSLTRSCERSIASYFDGGYLSADFSVSGFTTEGGWLESPLPASVVDELRAVPGIRAVETIRILPGHLYRGERIAIAAASDGLLEPARFPRDWFREGDPAAAYLAIVAGGGALIATQLRDRFDLHVGDTLDLDSPTGAVSLRIVGVVPDYVSDRGSVLVNRRVLVERWHDAQVNRMLVHLESGVPPQDARTRIAARFAAAPLKVLSMRELIDEHARHVRRAFALMDSVQLLIVFVTIAGVFDLLLSAILERRREIALWRLIGAPAATVRRAILVESATLGSGACALGAVVGCVTAWLWIRFNFRHLLGYHLEFHLDVARVVWFMVLAWLTTTLAGHFAAAWAVRHPIIQGMRSD